MGLKLHRVEQQAGAPDRAREMETASLVRSAAVAALAGSSERLFLARRAGVAVTRLAPGPLRQALARAVAALSADPCDEAELREALVCYGGVLERHGLPEDAAAAFETARSTDPTDPTLMLHAARAHRKAGNRAKALELYGRVREGGCSRMALFSALGEALLAEDADRALTAVLTEAESSSDGEVAAVVLEERAQARRRAGRWREAASDYAAAAVRYDDRRERLRSAHSLADLLLSRGDLAGAREALGAALDLAESDELAHTVQRLRTVARAEGDEVALRRWPAVGPTPMVTLMPAGRRGGAEDSMAPRLRDWRDALLTR